MLGYEHARAVLLGSAIEAFLYTDYLPSACARRGAPRASIFTRCLAVLDHNVFTFLSVVPYVSYLFSVTTACTVEVQGR